MVKVIYEINYSFLIFIALYQLITSLVHWHSEIFTSAQEADHDFNRRHYVDGPESQPHHKVTGNTLSVGAFRVTLSVLDPESLF